MRATAAAALVVGFGAAASPAQAFTTLYDFGDSLSDIGNVYSASGGAYPVSAYSGQGLSGRFTNGPNWLDGLSAKLGLGAVTASATGGHDYAVGGAQTGATNVNSGVSGFAGVPLVDLDQQVQTFKLITPSPQAGALYTLDIGANDIGNALSNFVTPGGTNTEGLTLFMEQAVGNTVHAIDDLYADGARSLVYFEVPDLSVVPAFASFGAEAGALAQQFNQGVLSGISTLEAQGLTVYDLPVFSRIDAIVADPAKSGFTNVSSPCFSGGPTTGGTACATPDSYLFWDTEHPTAAAHALIADAAFDLVTGAGGGGGGGGGGGATAPEPATWALIATGFAALGLMARRKKRALATV